MPLRDHFRPPIAKRWSWERFYCVWPATMVATLVDQLPPQYVAEPRLSPDYQLLVFDNERDRKLVATVEFVSPVSKDRGTQALVAKCTEMLRRPVCVSLVDIVTTPGANLYTELLALVACSDQGAERSSSATYATTCRHCEKDSRTRLEAWHYPLAVGERLPTLPIWLSESRAVPLDLETSYEQACRLLRIP